MRKEQILMVQRSCKIQKEITKVVTFYNKQTIIGFEFYHRTRVYKQKTTVLWRRKKKHLSGMFLRMN